MTIFTAAALAAMIAVAPFAAALAQFPGCPAPGSAVPAYAPLPGDVNPTTGAYTPSVANGGIAAPTPATTQPAVVPPTTKVPGQ